VSFSIAIDLSAEGKYGAKQGTQASYQQLISAELSLA
jgi:hypothetical protein